MTAEDKNKTCIRDCNFRKIDHWAEVTDKEPNEMNSQEWLDYTAAVDKEWNMYLRRRRWWIKKLITGMITIGIVIGLVIYMLTKISINVSISY